MKNIIWLASYPKSGNTWFRIFLTNLLQDKNKPADINQLERTPIASARKIFDEMVGVDAANVSHEEIDSLRPEVYEYLSRQAKETRFFKIHDAYTFVDNGCPLVSFNATRGAIYIIRNPLDVAVSFANHSGVSIDKCIERMNDESFCFCNKPGRLHNQLRQRLLSWGGHVCSWVDAKNLDLHLIRYEDMKHKPVETFTGAVKFAGLEKTSEQIKKALEFSHISEMQRQEQKNGFLEKSASCKSFFNKGELGYWREVLNSRQAKSIIQKHKDVMERFGYLNGKGELK